MTDDTIYRQAAIDAIQNAEINFTIKCDLNFGNYQKVMQEIFNNILFAEIRAIKKLPSAQPEPQWIPLSERPPEDLEEVNVTWVNHDPEPYYNFVKDKPFTATAVYYKEKWYWYSSTCADLLVEYGRNPNQEIDDGIEIIAWMPLPESYKEGQDEQT